MYQRLLWITLALVVFGLVMLSSAGVVDGQKKFGDSYYYLKRQLLFGALPGMIFLFVLSRVSYRIWQRTSILILLAALGLMAAVFVPGLGRTINGATSWLQLSGFSFQPVEVLKLSLVIYLAAWFGGKPERMKKWTYGTAPFFTVLAVAAGLLIMQPDVGTLVVVMAIGIGMFFIAGGNLKHLAAILMVIVIAVGVLIWVEPYRLDRIKAVWDPSYNPRGASYQLNQSLIAIGSGGLFGVGFGKSTQKFGILPESAGDSIFAIIGEELGLAGTAGTIFLFLALCVTLTGIAKRTSDNFGRLYVMGINVWIMSQAFINIAAISGVGPLTGIPIPFISYGGTSLMVVLMGMGIALNVARK